MVSTKLNVRVSSSREHPPRAYPGQLKKLVKCLALRVIFVRKCLAPPPPPPRTYYDGQMPGPLLQPINIQNN